MGSIFLRTHLSNWKKTKDIDEGISQDSREFSKTLGRFLPKQPLTSRSGDLVRTQNFRNGSV